MKGQIKGFTLDYETKKPVISLLLDIHPEDLERLGDKILSVDLRVYRERRSREANSYYHVLCGKIGEVIGQSMSWVCNDMLRKYGQISIVEGQAIYVVLPDTEDVCSEIDECENYHLKPTSQVKPGRDGLMYRTWLMLRGSHEYNTKEMSRLIDGVVSEAKELGIETITDTEKWEMMEQYDKKHSAE